MCSLSTNTNTYLYLRIIIKCAQAYHIVTFRYTRARGSIPSQYERLVAAVHVYRQLLFRTRNRLNDIQRLLAVRDLYTFESRALIRL